MEMASDLINFNINIVVYTIYNIIPRISSIKKTITICLLSNQIQMLFIQLLKYHGVIFITIYMVELYLILIIYYWLLKTFGKIFSELIVVHSWWYLYSKIIVFLYVPVMLTGGWTPAEAIDVPDTLTGGWSPAEAIIDELILILLVFYINIGNIKEIKNLKNYLKNYIDIKISYLMHCKMDCNAQIVFETMNLVMVDVDFVLLSPSTINNIFYMYFDFNYFMFYFNFIRLMCLILFIHIDLFFEILIYINCYFTNYFVTNNYLILNILFTHFFIEQVLPLQLKLSVLNLFSGFFLFNCRVRIF